MTHFEKKEPFLILAPNQTAIEFVDALLWRMPEESFLPHVVSEFPCSDLLVLSTAMVNLNRAAQVFNLLQDPIFLEHPIKTIYEFEDLTSIDKKQFSQQKYLAYRQAGYLISSH